MHYLVRVTPQDSVSADHPYVGYAKAFYKYTHTVKEQAYICSLVDCGCVIELIDQQHGTVVKKAIINCTENKN